MRRDNINYLAVGAFVVAMGILLLVMIYKITGKTGAADLYHVYYSNVAGIKYGTGVFYEGYQIGQVESITPDRRPEGLRYEVEFSVTKGWPLSEDCIAKVVASGLLAAVSIDISEGKSSALLKPGAEVQGQDQVNIFAAINDFAGQFQEFSKEGLGPVLANLNKRISDLAIEYQDLSTSTLRPFLESLRSRIDDPEIWKKINTTVDNLDDSTARLQQLLSDENQQSIREILNSMADASRDLRARLEDTRSKLNHVLDQTNELIATNSDDVTAAVSDAEIAASELKASLQEVSDHIAAVMYHLEGTSRHLNEFSREIRENPSSLLRGSSQQEEGTE